MKIIMIDIDTLRPDHLGCYGYHRKTSPNMDQIAKDGVVFQNCYVSDSPCLPSRAALHHGKFGFQIGAVNHGGTWADPLREGQTRDFRSSEDHSKLVQLLQNKGYYTATVSSFAGRHSSWWFLAGYNEVYDCGKGGMENQDEVTPKALELLERHQEKDDFFLHFNIWDPHTPYRVPENYGEPFANDLPPSWMTQDLIDQHQQTYGTHSANAPLHHPDSKPWDREVDQIKNLDDYKKWVDGYDTGIKYADEAVGKIIHKIKELGFYDDCAVILTSDHGENQGELNIYGDHQTADLITHRVPMIIKWPGKAPGKEAALHYQFDIGATLLELCGVKVPEGWDSVSFKNDFLAGREKGRERLFLSHCPWSCQRSVIFNDYILIKTYDDGLKDFPPLMLFNRDKDPHQLHNLAEEKPQIVKKGLDLLENWEKEQLGRNPAGQDPLQEVIKEGGPFHTRGRLPVYLDYYRSIGKPEIARAMEEKYGK